MTPFPFQVHGRVADPFLVLISIPNTESRVPRPRVFCEGGNDTADTTDSEGLLSYMHSRSRPLLRKERGIRDSTLGREIKTDWKARPPAKLWGERFGQWLRRPPISWRTTNPKAAGGILGNYFDLTNQSILSGSHLQIFGGDALGDVGKSLVSAASPPADSGRNGEKRNKKTLAFNLVL